MVRPLPKPLSPLPSMSSWNGLRHGAALAQALVALAGLALVIAVHALALVLEDVTLHGGAIDVRSPGRLVVLVNELHPHAMQHSGDPGRGLELMGPRKMKDSGLYMG